MTGIFKMPGTILGRLRRSQSKSQPMQAAGWKAGWSTGLFLIFLCAFPLQAQIDLSSLDRLSARAEESVEINLDSAAIQLAGGFLSAGKGKAASQIQEVLSKLTAITVRTLEFEDENKFSSSDLEGVRNQLRSPAWSKIINVNGNDERVEVYIRQANGAINGVTALVAEKKELTIASIEGEIDLQALAALGGSFGIPQLPIPGMNAGGGKGKGGGKN